MQHMLYLSNQPNINYWSLVKIHFSFLVVAVVAKSDGAYQSGLNFLTVPRIHPHATWRCLFKYICCVCSRSRCAGYQHCTQSCREDVSWNTGRIVSKQDTRAIPQFGRSPAKSVYAMCQIGGSAHNSTYPGQSWDSPIV